MLEKQQYVERFNIPVSNSLLHRQEYNNTLNLLQLHTEKRRSTSEKNKNKKIDTYNDNISKLHLHHASYVVNN